MAIFCSNNVSIAGIASAVLKNEFDIKTVEKFQKSTGINETRKTLKNQVASDLGYEAANHLINELNVDKNEIGILVFVTLSPDYRRPATSCVLQKRLGLNKECAALDVSHGCSGFIYGHQVIESMMQTSDVKYGLLILGETASKIVGKNDHTKMLFGDAGAAVLYEKDDLSSNTSLLYTDGTGFKSIILPGGGFRDMNSEPNEILCSDGTIRTQYDLQMDGAEVMSFTISDVPKAINEFLDYTKTSMDDYNRIIFHQANSFIIKQLSRKYKLVSEKVPISIDRYGNTSSVSIPLTLCDYYGEKQGNIDEILACGFGVGLSWGVTAFSVNSDTIFPVIETDEYYQEGIIDISKL